MEIEKKVKKMHNNKTKATSEFTETVILINGISTVSDIFVWQIKMVGFLIYDHIYFSELHKQTRFLSRYFFAIIYLIKVI